MDTQHDPVEERGNIEEEILAQRRDGQLPLTMPTKELTSSVDCVVSFEESERGTMNSHVTSEAELTRILGLMNEQSASLILMVLCDDSLDLHQVKVESGNEMLESKIKAVRNMTGFPSREEIARAAKHFGGTLFTEGDIISFTCAKLYSACAGRLFNTNPQFLLLNCSLNFLHESLQSPYVNDESPVIQVSEIHYDALATRLAEAIEEGNYSMSLSHSILKNNTIVDKVFQELRVRKTNTTLHQRAQDVTFPYKTHKGKYLLQWAIHAHSVYLLKQIVSTGYSVSEREIIKCFHTCSSSGNEEAMAYLFTEYELVVSPAQVRAAFFIAIDKCRTQMVNLLMQYGPQISDLSFDRQKKLFHIAGEQENIRLCGTIIAHVLRNTPLISFRVMAELRRNPQSPFKTVCSDILQIAATDGHLFLAEFVMAYSEINCQDELGRTPSMNAAFSGNRTMFDLLLSKGANLSSSDKEGNTVLHIACWKGDQSLVEDLLPSFDINIRGQSDWTPVMVAAVSGKREVFELLVRKGADLTLIDKYKNTLLHLACEGENTSIIKCLFPSCDINLQDANGATPVMCAAGNGNEEVFKFLVSKGADLSLTDISGDYALHKACEGGNVAIVKSLLQSNDINLRGGNGHTPLMKTVCRGHRNVFDLLVSEHADMTLVDNDGDNLLHLASEVGDLDMVKRCLPGSDINCRDKHGWTPLMAALVFGESEVSHYLVKEGSDTTLLDEVGDDVVTLAYRGGCEEIIYQLNLKDDETKKTEKWNNDMRYLVCGYSEPILQYERGSSELVQKDGFDDSLLHLACRGGKLQYVEHILPSYDINVRGRYDWTPVMMAALCGHLDVCQYLISHQADLSFVSDTGEDVLSLACRGKSVHIIGELLTREEFATRQVHVSLKGNTLLHLACIGGIVENVEHLLPDYDINVRGQYGWTPAMIAALCGHLDVFEYLLSQHIDLFLVSDTGEGLLTMAMWGRNTDIVKYLVTLQQFQNTK